VLLVEFVQGLADYTGETTYLAGEDRPDTRITLPRAVKALDFDTAARLLKDTGYELSRETYRGREVYWVQRLLVPQRKQGGIIRPKPGGGKQGEPVDEPDAADQDPGGRRDRLSLFERRSGEGVRFLLTFETNSRDEAEEAMELLKAYRPRGEGTKAR
jgi:hypothetical protein